MINSTIFLLAAAKQMQKAENAQRYISDNKASYLVSKQFVIDNKIKLRAFAYYLGYFFELIFLGAPIISYLDIFNGEGVIFYAIVCVIIISLIIIMNAMISRAIEFKFDSINNLYKETMANATSIIIDFPLTENKTLNIEQKKESKLVFILMLMMTGLLAILRASIMRPEFNITQDWSLLISSFALAFFMLAIFFSFHSATTVMRSNRRLAKNYSLAIKTRDIALNEYAIIVEKFLKKRPHSDNPRDNIYTDSERNMVNRYFELIENRRDYNFLIPVQRVFIKVFFNGKPAPEVQVVGFTPQNKEQILRTDTNGMVTLEWKSFNPTLSLILVGNKRLRNIVASDKLQEVELIDHIDRNKPNRRIS